MERGHIWRLQCEICNDAVITSGTLTDAVRKIARLVCRSYEFNSQTILALRRFDKSTDILVHPTLGIGEIMS